MRTHSRAAGDLALCGSCGTCSLSDINEKLRTRYSMQPSLDLELKRSQLCVVLQFVCFVLKLLCDSRDMCASGGSCQLYHVESVLLEFEQMIINVYLVSFSTFVPGTDL